MRRVLMGLLATAGISVAIAAQPAEAASIWACTPITRMGNGSLGQNALYIYNGTPTTANVAAKWLNKTGANLAGLGIPNGGVPTTTYPGQSGAATVVVGAGTTLQVKWTSPLADVDLSGNVVNSIRVVSDQPVVVGVDNQATGMTTCSPVD